MSDAEYDVIVVGGGAAGLTAASVAAAEGCRVLLAEATGLIGGTSAISGGMAWMPANSKQDGDTVEAARLYLERSAPSAASVVREAFLTRAAEAVDYLERNTSLVMRPVPVYPDYYPDLPGATSGGRVLEALPFDGQALGQQFRFLRPPLPEFMLFGGMMISRADLPHFRHVLRRAPSTWRVGSLLMRHALQRVRYPRGTTLYLGNALTGRLFKSALDLGVEIRLNTAIGALIRNSGRVAGVEMINPDGGRSNIRARKGVILASGGFSHDPELRKMHLPAAAQTVTANVPSGALCGIRLAETVGGAIDESAANRAFWVPASRFQRPDGSPGVFPHTVTDRAKPGLIAVDQSGRRFVNEARSYHEFVLAMLRNAESAVPSYLICDSRFLWKYGLGRIKPFSVSIRAEIVSGYLYCAATIDELARKLSLSPAALRSTIESYNVGALQGEDPEFGRGSDGYQRHLGDAEVRPNPCVAAIAKPPYYAVAVYPADLGTAAGLRTDERARVLDRGGAANAGLYACGNDMNSVMNGAYPGPGITLGPALTFGYIAGRDIAGR